LKVYEADSDDIVTARSAIDFTRVGGHDPGCAVGPTGARGDRRLEIHTLFIPISAAVQT
jgi:hypothetical protein